jgi:hypothetical protein
MPAEAGGTVASVTYEQVFGVPVGGELSAGQAVAYTACPAVQSLNRQLLAFSFFSAAGILGGRGPLLRPGPKHEFNRHHAGLAVDIMLNMNNDQYVALGQQLVVAFWKLGSVMQWRGVIYQDVTLDLVAGTRRAATYRGGDHFDHIHIDWCDPHRVVWHNGISSVPYRVGSVVQQIPVSDPGHRIAQEIPWPVEAMTIFETDATVRKALGDVMARHAAGLPKMVLADALGLTGSSASVAGNDLVGKWNVAIGDWSGVFVFALGGGVYWADDTSAAHHRGRWSVVGNEIHWKFSDEGDFRTFVVTLPVFHASMKGKILPVGQGFFEMKKA